jgi:hypothetical protein
MKKLRPDLVSTLAVQKQQRIIRELSARYRKLKAGSEARNLRKRKGAPPCC